MKAAADCTQRQTLGQSAAFQGQTNGQLHFPWHTHGVPFGRRRTWWRRWTAGSNRNLVRALHCGNNSKNAEVEIMSNRPFGRRRTWRRRWTAGSNRYLVRALHCGNNSNNAEVEIMSNRPFGRRRTRRRRWTAGRAGKGSSNLRDPQVSSDNMADLHPAFSSALHLESGGGFTGGGLGGGWLQAPGTRLLQLIMTAASSES